MIILYGFGPHFGLPEVSPFVTKTEVHLKMSGLAYEKRRSAPNASPKGQLPFIDDDGQMIADSCFIRDALERRHGIDFDAGLSDLERAQAWAVERMIEQHFCPAMVWMRWMLPENFEKGPAMFANSAPEEKREAMREQMRGGVAQRMLAQGLGRHTPDEITMLGTRAMAALSTLLGDKQFLMGDKPCGVDATMFAALAGLLTPYFDSPLRREAEKFANLRAYVDRMMQRYYPEHAWDIAAAA